MLAQSQLASDVAAYYIMTLLHYELSYILTLQSQGIEAAIAGLPVSESFLLKIAYEFRMTLLEDDCGRHQKRFPVGHKIIQLVFRHLPGLLIRRYMGD